MSPQLAQYSLNRHHRSNRSSRDLESSLNPSVDNPATGEDLEVFENKNSVPVDSRENTNSIIEDGNKEKIPVQTNKESASKYFSEMDPSKSEGTKDVSGGSRGNERIPNEESKQSISVLKEDLSNNLYEPLENSNVLLHKNINEISPAEDRAVKDGNNFGAIYKFSNEFSPSTDEKLKVKEAQESLLFDPNQRNKVEGDNNKGSLEYHMNNFGLKNGNPVHLDRDESDENSEDTDDHNVTVRVFQFEHSFEPHDGAYTVSNIDFALDSKDDDGKNGQNQSYSMKSKTSEGLSQEKLRLLLMNKIKWDKNDEKIQNANASCSDPNSLGKSQYKVRSLKSNLDNEAKENLEDFSKDSHKTFSLKLSDGKSELDIQIATNKPKNVEVNKLKPKSSFSEFNARKQCNQKGFDDNKQQSFSTKGCLKDIINKLKQQTTPKATSSVTCKKTTESCNKCTDTNDTDSLKAIENVVYKLVPIINSAKSSCEHSKTDKTNAVVKDQENKTHKMYIELKKKDDISPCSNTSVSFDLSSVKISNETVPLPDYRVLKSKSTPSDEPMQNFQTEMKSQIHQPTNRETESHPVTRNKKREIEKREASDKQIRGGQSCCTEGKTVPCSADPETYFESAHCLRFSDLW